MTHDELLKIMDALQARLTRAMNREYEVRELGLGEVPHDQRMNPHQVVPVGISCPLTDPAEKMEAKFFVVFWSCYKRGLKDLGFSKGDTIIFRQMPCLFEDPPTVARERRWSVYTWCEVYALPKEGESKS